MKEDFIDHMIKLRIQATAQQYLTDDPKKRAEYKELVANYNEVINWLIWRKKNVSK